MTKLNKPIMVFEWCVARRGCKHEHQNDMCLKEIGLRAQDIFIKCSKLNNQHNWEGTLCGHLMYKESHFDQKTNNKMFT